MKKNSNLTFVLTALLALGLLGFPVHQTHSAEQVEQPARACALDANVYRALAHQEKSLAVLEQALDSRDSRDFQQALLQALAAQRLPLEGRDGLQLRGLSGLADKLRSDDFPLRWQSPAPGQDELEQLLQWLDEQSARFRP